MTTTHNSDLAHLSDDELRRVIRSMQFELERRGQGLEWTGRHHEWDKPFEDPTTRSCRRCEALMVPAGVEVDLTNDDVVNKLYLRETCPR